MAQPKIQPSFAVGELAPALFSRVDLEKYKSAAALVRNFFVDYRGGVSSRPGTKYVLQAFKSATPVRLLPFQASTTVGYILEFGDHYIRFHNNGAPVLESALTITNTTQANPCVVQVANSYSVGDWVFISNVGGMTQLNGRYFIVRTQNAGAISLNDLFGNAIDSTAYSAYTSGGKVQRVYTINSPYASTDLALLKYAQNVSQLILTHPSYAPRVLTLNSATNWSLTTITFGSTVGTPTSPSAATTLAAGSVNYSYVITAVDQNGQESAPSAAATLSNKTDIRTTAGTNTISWTAVSGATSYNVYEAEPSYAGAVPSGASYGFIGNSTGTSLVDSNIAPNFSITPPVTQNPFSGASVIGTTITAGGSYTVAPSVTFAAPPSGHTATGTPIFTLASTAINAGGAGYNVGDALAPVGVGSTTYVVTGIGGGGSVASISLVTPPPSITGSLPTNPLNTTTNNAGAGATLNLTWTVTGILLSSGGDGYLSAPAITFSAGAATATAQLGTASNGNPSVPGFVNQRLVLAGPTGNPQQFNMSQPGSYYNFNISNPIQADDAISAQLVAGRLNSIKSMLQMPSGLIVFTDQQNWLINGGGFGIAVTPIDIVANPQSYVGASDVPPIAANFDILFVQSKGSIVRDLTYNFYANIWTGTDISVLSSHLFYGFTITQWAWAEEPFKVVWATRNDGTMLALTFLKEQDIIGWSHFDTQGVYLSVATVTEAISTGNVDAVYVQVQRVINGQTVKYIERVAERILNGAVTNTWAVDAGIQYTGSPATSFLGADQLAGMACAGLADGVAFTANVSATGTFTLASPASNVVIGLGYTCQLQTLPLEDTAMGTTSQGKVKKINAVDVRVNETLGLKIGSSVSTIVPMKDLVVGNVSSMLVGQPSQKVTNLVSGDARTFLDPTFTVPGQYFIQLDQPYPATILGVIPQVLIGDTAK